MGGWQLKKCRERVEKGNKEREHLLHHTSMNKSQRNRILTPAELECT